MSETSSGASPTLGATVLIDGHAWRLVYFATDGKARAVRTAGEGEGAKQLSVRFDWRELVAMGGEIYGLPGRMEAPKAGTQTVVLEAAAVTLAAS